MTFFKLKHFANSLTDSAFAYISLLPNFIHTWQDLESQFHAQFYRTKLEVLIVDLARLTQQPNELLVEKYMTRLKQARNRCYTSLREA